MNSYLELGISALALVVSYLAYRKAKETALKEIELSVKTHELSVKAHELSQQENLLAQANIEFQIASNIRETENRVSDIGIEVAKALAESKKEDDDNDIKNILNKVYHQAIESNLNAYEESCAKYLDGKVDKDRFKKNYHKQIRRLIEDSKELMKYFDKPSSSYKCILKVYNEWYNLEQ